MEDKPIRAELSYPLLLVERLLSAVEDAHSFKLECTTVGNYAHFLAEKLRFLVRFTCSAPSLYDRPVRRIVAEVCKNLDRALTLVRKCKRRNVLHRVVAIIGVADFRKVQNLLEASVGDVKWLENILGFGSGATGENVGIYLTLPPIASNDPILAWVWSSIASIHLRPLPEKIEAANQLEQLAQDNDRNKQIIVEEGGVPPLLKLLKDTGSPEAQIAAATALLYLANAQERVATIVNEQGVTTVVKVLADSPMSVQILTATLVAKMARHDSVAQNDFARENAIRPLVTLLSFETFSDDPMVQQGKHSIHSIVQINKEMENFPINGSKNNNHCRSYMTSFQSFHTEGSTRGGGNRKERENEKPEMKLKLKISCAEALWMLARGSVSNSKRITETKGLLCLAKLVEKGEGELKFNCLMTIMEITAAAESNADLRHAAFKTNAPAAKAVIDQLLRVIKESDSPKLQIPAIKSIGSLARIFPARETRVIGPLVAQLENRRSQEVATEAAIELGKFTCPDNFLRAAHSKAIVEFNCVPPLMRLLRMNERAQLHGLILLCYLVLHAGNNEAMEQGRVLTALEGADRTVVAQHPELRELVSKAIHHINLYNTSAHSQRFSYVP